MADEDIDLVGVLDVELDRARGLIGRRDAQHGPHSGAAVLLGIQLQFGPAARDIVDQRLRDSQQF